MRFAGVFNDGYVTVNYKVLLCCISRPYETLYAASYFRSVRIPR